MHSLLFDGPVNRHRPQYTYIVLIFNDKKIDDSSIAIIQVPAGRIATVASRLPSMHLNAANVETPRSFLGMSTADVITLSDDDDEVRKPSHGGSSSHAANKIGGTAAIVGEKPLDMQALFGVAAPMRPQTSNVGMRQVCFGSAWL